MGVGAEHIKVAQDLLASTINQARDDLIFLRNRLKKKKSITNAMLQEKDASIDFFAWLVGIDNKYRMLMEEAKELEKEIDGLLKEFMAGGGTVYMNEAYSRKNYRRKLYGKRGKYKRKNADVCSVR